MIENPDRLFVTGFGDLDGEYPFDLIALISDGHPEAFTYEEWHLIKLESKVRAGEFIEAWDAGDTSLQMVVAVVLLTRKGKRVAPSDFWKAPSTTSLRFTIDMDAHLATGESDALPPPQEPLANEATGSPVTSGGASSRPTLVSPETDPSPTGALGTAISARATSAV